MFLHVVYRTVDIYSGAAVRAQAGPPRSAQPGKPKSGAARVTSRTRFSSSGTQGRGRRGRCRRRAGRSYRARRPGRTGLAAPSPRCAGRYRHPGRTRRSPRWRARRRARPARRRRRGYEAAAGARHDRAQRVLPHRQGRPTRADVHEAAAVEARVAGHGPQALGGLGGDVRPPAQPREAQRGAGAAEGVDRTRPRMGDVPDAVAVLGERRARGHPHAAAGVEGDVAGAGDARASSCPGGAGAAGDAGAATAAPGSCRDGCGREHGHDAQAPDHPASVARRAVPGDGPAEPRRAGAPPSVQRRSQPAARVARERVLHAERRRARRPTARDAPQPARVPERSGRREAWPRPEGREPPDWRKCSPHPASERARSPTGPGGGTAR